VSNPAEDDHIYRDLIGIFTSYTVTNYNDLDNRLEELRLFIQRTKNISLDLNSLRNYVYKMKMHMDFPKELVRSEAELFTKKRKVRKYKFGSDFCPSCGIFKNYEKECHRCGFHEMTF
jgi:hypothetical protein